MEQLEQRMVAQKLEIIILFIPTFNVIFLPRYPLTFRVDRNIPFLTSSAPVEKPH
jgi:hypothetical protein